AGARGGGDWGGGAEARARRGGGAPDGNTQHRTPNAEHRVDGTAGARPPPYIRDPEPGTRNQEPDRDRLDRGQWVGEDDHGGEAGLAAEGGGEDGDAGGLRYCPGGGGGA